MLIRSSCWLVRLLSKHLLCNINATTPTHAASSTSRRITSHTVSHCDPRLPQQQQQQHSIQGLLLRGRGLALAAVAHTTPDSPWQALLELLALQQQQPQQPQDAQHQQQQLAAALEAAAADKAGLSAQQLLPLVSAAAAAREPQLLPLLLSTLPPHQFAEALTALADQHSSSSSSSTLAKASRPPEPTTQDSKDSSSTAGPSTRRQQTAALTKAARGCLQQQQSAMDASSTAAVAAALASSKAASAFSVLSVLALEHLPQMSPGQLVQLLQAFAAVQHYNQAICAAAAQHAAQLIKQQGFRLVQPAAASTPATNQQQHPQQEQQQQQQEGSAFTGDQLVSLLQALASLRHHDPPLLEAACTCVLRSPQRSLSHVVSLAHTCALLNHFHQPLFDTAVQMAQQAMQQQQEQQKEEEEGGSDRDLAYVLAQLSWACGVMDHRADGTFLQQLSAWTAQLDVQQLSAQELRLWHEVQTSLTDAALLRPQGSPNSLSSSLVVAAQAAWAKRQTGRRQTPFQQEVVAALQAAGVRYRLNVAQDGPVVVDVALAQRQVGARYRVALQLHPQEDFTANPPHGPLGPTAARWRALQARGWRVVTLQQSEWRRLKTKQEQVEYAWQLGQGVEVSAPGMPHLVHQVLMDKDKGSSGKPSLSQTLLRILLEGH